jgi:anti-sigma regulatory factor (Ser/Thr protein kinase)
VFLRHYCVLLAGSDAHRPKHDFAGDRRAARGFNGDIAQHVQRWRNALEADDDAGLLAQRMARKSLLAVAGLVSVHDHTWTTDRETSAHRWSEIEPAQHDGPERTPPVILLRHGRAVVRREFLRRERVTGRALSGVSNGGRMRRTQLRQSLSSLGPRRLREPRAVVEPLRVELENSDLAPGTARRALESWLRAVECSASVRGDALLVVSELATNVVRHTASALVVIAAYDYGRLRIEVHDSSAHGPVAVTDPEVSGFGLTIVASLVDAWGWEPTPFGKRVWSEMLC